MAHDGEGDHAHRPGHNHDHGAAARRAGARHQGRLAWALVLVASFGVVQVVVGLLTRSLALLSDAGHMATDALGLAMALAAIRVASADRRHPRRTFGLYRLEILAALANTVLLFAVAGYVAWEAVGRLADPPTLATLPVLAVGLVGLGVNVAAFQLLREGSGESLNVQGAALEVLADLVGSVGVVVGAAVQWLTGWGRVDPLVGVGIGLFILPRAWRLGRQTLRVLVQAAPDHIDVGAVEADLRAIPGVVDVHDLHVWTLTSDMEVATAHLMVRAGTDQHGVLDQARHLLADRHRLGHATLQIEPDDHRGCDEVTW